MSLELNKISGSLKDQLDENIMKDINSLYKKIDDESEFEFMFFNYKKDQNRMGLESFLKILEYLSYKSKAQKLDLVKTIELDINYMKKTGEVFRITLQGVDTINKYIKMLGNRKNHVIFSVLVGYSQNVDNVKLMKKIKDKENIINIDDYDIRVRLSKETTVTKKEIDELKKLDENQRNNVSFRYKQRVSLIIKDDKDSNLSIDLTNTKMTNILNRLDKTVPIYELEIDLTSKSKNLDKKYLDQMISESNTLLKILQQSNFVISNSLQNEVLDIYAKLLQVKKDEMISLAGRKPQSLEIQHVVDNLPNKYAVTDKADGERYFLIIYKNAVFLISDLLGVKNTGILLPENKKQYNNTIIDGELIFIASENRYIFMGFDCLYKEGQDIRQINSFLERVQNLDDVIENCFVNKNHKFTKIKSYDGKFDSKEILNFNEEEIKKFLNNLNHDIKLDKQSPLIRRKYFIPVLGGQDNEIFKYSKLLWNMYVTKKDTNCPYILDGLIYHPLDQKYIVSAKDSKYLEYKWKPEDKNSIDFYVTFERSKETGKIVTLYDNSKSLSDDPEENEVLRNKPYKILNLHVGKMVRNIRTYEQPILFTPEVDSDKYLAYLYLRDGEVRDEQGNIIQDKTVVEFYYNNDVSIPDKHRWVPIRTRYDKTESVQRYGKKYGNYDDIANKIWRSIRNPFTMGDINILSTDETYKKHIEVLIGKIDHSIIMSERKENIYYQLKTNLAKPMTNFHNWIKSVLIYTYYYNIYQRDKRKLSVLDFGVGRGGDNLKFYYASVDFLVGTDVDNNGIISPSDGAISRYNTQRKKKPDFPRMFFIQADGRALLNYDDQNKALGGMSDKNKQLINQFFSKDDKKRTKFDRINCQFAIHYFFENEITWNNFTQNITDYIKDDGYMVATTFDADKIIELLDNVSQYTVYYTDTKGDQKVLFEIVKKYKDLKKGDLVPLGTTIELYNSLYSQEGNYIPEYLVQKDFIVKEMLEKCDMELVESDLFENQFIINQEFFKKGVFNQESKEETRQFFEKVAKFFDQTDEINKASFELTRLYRYYVFRKKTTYSSSGKGTAENKSASAKSEKKNDKTLKKKKQKGGHNIKNTIMNYNEMVFNDAPDLFDPMKFVRRDLILDEGDELQEYSFMTSLHDILKTNKVIPNTISVPEFYNDISFGLVPDNSLNKNVIRNLGNKFEIRHNFTESDLSTEMALNGLNIFVVEKDCDGSNVKSYLNKNKSGPAAVLYFDGNKYYPVYKVKDDVYSGMFTMDKKFIKNILKN